jgi:DNA topoisomerase IA
MKLLIVFDALIVDKLKGFLGPDWIVCDASNEHLSDWRVNESSLKPPFDFKITFSPKMQDPLAKIRRVLALFQTQPPVGYMAVDPTMDGDALFMAIQQGLPEFEFRRVCFRKLTKEAVLKAVVDAGPLPTGRREAAKASLTIDLAVSLHIRERFRVVNSFGKLWIDGRLAALILARVFLNDTLRRLQSNMEPLVWFAFDLSLTSLLKSAGGGTARVRNVTDPNGLMAFWSPKDLIECRSYKEASDEMRRILEMMTSSRLFPVFEVVSINRPGSLMPVPHPLTTAEYYDLAIRLLGMSLEKAQEALKDLFHLGAISNPLTDNPNLSSESLAGLAAYLKTLADAKGGLVKRAEVGAPLQTGGDASMKSPYFHPEAICPTDFSKASAGKTNNQRNAYHLIRLWAMGSLVQPVLWKVIEIGLAGPMLGEGNVFVARAEAAADTGWLELFEGGTRGDGRALVDLSRFLVARKPGSAEAELAAWKFDLLESLKKGDKVHAEKVHVCESPVFPPEVLTIRRLADSLTQDGVFLQPERLFSAIQNLVPECARFRDKDGNLQDAPPNYEGADTDWDISTTVLGETFFRTFHNRFGYVLPKFVGEVDRRIRDLAQGSGDARDVLKWFLELLETEDKAAETLDEAAVTFARRNSGSTKYKVEGVEKKPAEEKAEETAEEMAEEEAEEEAEVEAEE